MPVKNISNTRPMGKSALRNLEMQRNLAQALQGQAMQPLRGRMAGRVYVAPSPMEGVAKLGQMLAGTYGQNKANEREAQIEADERSSFLEGIQNYNTAMQPVAGTAARAETNVIPPQGDKYSIHTGNPVYQPASGQYQAAQAEIPARERTKQEKIQEAINLMGSKNERLRRFGENRYAESLVPTKPLVVSKNERLVDPNDPSNVILEAEPELEAKILQAQQLYALINNPDTPEDQKQGLKSQLRILQKGGENQRPLRPIHIKDSTGDYAFFPGEKHARRITSEEGEHLRSANYDPDHQQTLAQAKASGKVWGEQTTEALRNLPNTINQAEKAFTHVKELLAHEGFEDAVGIGLRQLGAGFVPGSQVADWDTRLQQLKDGAFLVAFEELKGGGHITEIEGIKATRAKNRMLAATSEDAFQRAAEDYLKILQDGLESARALAEQAPPGYYQGLKSTGALDSENFDKKRAKTSEGQNNVNEPDLVESILQSEGIE